MMERSLLEDIAKCRTTRCRKTMEVAIHISELTHAKEVITRPLVLIVASKTLLIFLQDFLQGVGVRDFKIEQ